MIKILNKIYIKDRLRSKELYNNVKFKININKYICLNKLIIKELE